MIDIETAEPFVRAHRGKLFVVKVGGECLATSKRVQRVARELARVEAFGPRLVVVHGAGPQTDALQRGLGEEPNKHGGRRITSKLALRALQHATLGELGPALAAAMGAAGAKASTLGAGAGVLMARRRPPVIEQGDRIDFGYVGDLRNVDVAPIAALIDAGVVPVLSPPASDGEGGFLNVNADLVAARVASALGAEKLCLLTGAPGILEDPEDPTTLYSTRTLDDLKELSRKGSLRGGMLVKAEAIRYALEGGVARVHVVSGIQPNALFSELYTAEGSGTLVAGEHVGGGVPGGKVFGAARDPSFEETVA